MELIYQEIISGVILVIATLISLSIHKLTGYLRAKGVTQKLSNQKELSSIAVKAVEQLYSGAKGSEKFELAKDKLIRMLASKNIKVREEDIDMLIESSVQEIKKAYKGK